MDAYLPEKRSIGIAVIGPRYTAEAISQAAPITKPRLCATKLEKVGLLL